MSENSTSTSSFESGERIRLAQRLAFLQMTDDDRRRLRALAPRLNASSDAFVEQFYRHLFSFKETARFLEDPELVARLKRMQQSHLQSMLEDEINEDYIAQRRHVGDIHAHVGISPQMFLGAYNQYLQYGLKELASAPDLPIGDFVAEVQSLLKAVFLDVEMTLDAYFAEATQNLRQALDMVFRANTELRQFAQLTSHDLKTPLATVANLCDEALDEFGSSMPAGATELVEAAKQRTYRMSAMIDELLELSASVEDFEANVEVDSRQVLDEAIDRLGPRLALHEIELKIAPQLPVVWGNRVRLREAFYNLLSNAAKFIDKRPGQIVVSAQVARDECTISIADNGPGIPRENLDQIFSPFRRLRMHQDRPGSGLGLYFAKNLVEQQGGRIWAESELGQGSTFHVTLRRHA
ncbi:MAG TPA: protoglobin domain-containing protein [Pirellulales bacterium]|jgi:signal transduction histidine kinase|nr:protoglobin domain-containing protein [Pirellulales bacterium]